MLPDEKIGCHRLARKCRDGVVNDHCQLWMQIRGRDPQTGTEVDHWSCADAIIPRLLIENAQMARQTGASVDALRSEVKKADDDRQRLLMAARQRFLE